MPGIVRCTVKEGEKEKGRMGKGVDEGRTGIENGEMGLGGKRDRERGVGEERNGKGGRGTKKRCSGGEKESWVLKKGDEKVEGW